MSQLPLSALERTALCCGITWWLSFILFLSWFWELLVGLSYLAPTQLGECPWRLPHWCSWWVSAGFLLLTQPLTCQWPLHVAWTPSQHGSWVPRTKIPREKTRSFIALDDWISEKKTYHFHCILSFRTWVTKSRLYCRGGSLDSTPA